MDQYIRVNPDKLSNFCKEVFISLGVSDIDAAITTDVLIAADLRGIASHGTARLVRYVKGLKQGMMNPACKETILKETMTSLVTDGNAGLGQPVSYRTMKKVIEKAEKAGMCFAAVRNSNHYGIAGYYSMMALEKDMMGISLTNSAPQVVPTWGITALMGTNPISVAIPAGKEKPYVLDMSTSVVPMGKLEVYNRKEQKLPLTWAVDPQGLSLDNAELGLENILNRRGGGLLPLGGIGEENGGHKGYGLSLLVEILSGVLAGSAFSDMTYPKDDSGSPLPSGIGHFFGAVKVDIFQEMSLFKSDMDLLINKIKDSKKASGQERIYIHGEKEFEQTIINREKGIPLHAKVIESLQSIGRECEVPFNFSDLQKR